MGKLLKIIWCRHFKVPEWKKTLREIDKKEITNTNDHSYYYEGKL